MIIKTYEDFLNEEINLRKKLIGGAIGLSTLVPNSIHSKDLGTNKDTIVNTNHSYELNKFVDSIRLERPELFTEDFSNKKTIEFGKFERIEYLRNRLEDYENENGIKLNIDLLSSPSNTLPFTINYFYVRGIDDSVKGPFLIEIVKLDFNKIITIGEHSIMFNFTRTQGVNSIGAKINF